MHRWAPIGSRWPQPADGRRLAALQMPACCGPAQDATEDVSMPGVARSHWLLPGAAAVAGVVVAAGSRGTPVGGSNAGSRLIRVHPPDF